MTGYIESILFAQHIQLISQCFFDPQFLSEHRVKTESNEVIRIMTVSGYIPDKAMPAAFIQ